MLEDETKIIDDQEQKSRDTPAQDALNDDPRERDHSVSKPAEPAQPAPIEVEADAEIAQASAEAPKEPQAPQAPQEQIAAKPTMEAPVAVQKKSKPKSKSKAPVKISPLDKARMKTRPVKRIDICWHCNKCRSDFPATKKEIESKIAPKRCRKCGHKEWFVKGRFIKGKKKEKKTC